MNQQNDTTESTINRMTHKFQYKFLVAIEVLMLQMFTAATERVNL